MRQRGQSPQPRRASQGDIGTIIAEAKARALAAQPAVPWQTLSTSKSTSGPGNFAIHGQSVRQVQVRTPSFSNSSRSFKHSQSASATTSKQQQPGKHEGQVASSMQASHGYLHMLKAMPRSNSMPGHSSFQGASAPVVRAPSRAPSRGRQDRPADLRTAPPVSKAELNGIVFKQSRRTDNLVVARTLAARLASPHSLHLDNLKLTGCCIVEGEEQVTTLSYQHNTISCISCLEHLPQLTILDMYSNQIQSLQGLPKAPALRGLMLGRNFLSTLDGLEVMTSLEVLDLQSNLIEEPLGLTTLTGLRRLNLAGNRITSLCSLQTLTRLEDLSLSRNYIATLLLELAAPANAKSSMAAGSLLPASLRKLALGNNRVVGLDDLKPLQQLTALQHLELEGNPCCGLHPPSRFRIEVVARHCSNLHQLDAQQITHAERSLAAAMRWQDELASRATLPSQPRTHTPQAAPAIPRPCTATLQQPAIGQATAPGCGRAPRTSVSVRSATPTLQAGADTPDQWQDSNLAVKLVHTSSASTTFVDPGLLVEQERVAGRPGTAPMPSQADALGSCSSSPHAELAVLARLPSAKGHHLVSYASSLPGRPASPMKNPGTPGDLLNSSALSVKTVSMQVPKGSPSDGPVMHRTSSSAVHSDPTAPVVTETRINTAEQQHGGRDMLPEQSSVPVHGSSTAVAGNSPGSAGMQGTYDKYMPEPGYRDKAGNGHLSTAAAKEAGPLISSYSAQAVQSNRSALPGSPQQAQAPLRRSTSFSQAGARVQHAIPERLLTASQASALLSGLPPGSVAALPKQLGPMAGCTDAPDSLTSDTEALAESLLCVGQTHVQTPRAPHPIPHDPPVRPPAAASSQQQQQQKPVKSAELVDGYQLHIRGDALDALQSPVCVNAQEVTLTGMHWGKIAAAMQSLAALKKVRKLTLIDNDMQHLHQVEDLSLLTGLEELNLKQNPVIKQVLLRPFICFSLPNLKEFNGCTVTEEEGASAQSMFQPLQAARLTANKDPFVLLAQGYTQDGESKPISDRQARVAQVLSSQNKENVSDNANTTLAAQNLWSGMVHKLVQQDLRAKKFEEIWPNVLDDMILQGFAGAY